MNKPNATKDMREKTKEGLVRKNDGMRNLIMYYGRWQTAYN